MNKVQGQERVKTASFGYKDVTEQHFSFGFNSPKLIPVSRIANLWKPTRHDKISPGAK